MKKKINKLHDVEVQAVGLVSVGANQEQFFLLKSQDAEVDMSDKVDTIADEVDDEVVESFATRLWKSFSAKLAARKDEEVVEKAPEVEVVEEQQPEVAAETEAEAEVEKSAAVEEKVEDEEKVALAKANQELQDRLEAVEKALKEKEDAVERAEYVKKAQEFGHLGVDGEVLAEQLHFLAKADEGRYAFWTGLLASVEAKAKDSGLFDEIGKSGDDGEQKDFEAQLVEAIAKSGDKSIRDTLASMSRDEAEAYLCGRREALRRK